MQRWISDANIGFWRAYICTECADSLIIYLLMNTGLQVEMSPQICKFQQAFSQCS